MTKSKEGVLEDANRQEEELLNTNEIVRAIRATNKIWDLTYYDQLLDTDNYQLCVTPQLTDEYLNSIQAVQVDLTLQKIEHIFKINNMTPAIFTDPQTSAVLKDELIANGYQIIEEETELWRIFDLKKQLPDAASVLRIPESEIEFITFDPKTDSKNLEIFLKIDQTSNQIDDETIQQVRRNLLQKSREDAEVIPIIALVNGSPAACLCLGISDGIGNISEAGTLENSRGQGIFPWLRIQCLRIAKEHGCDFVMSNTLASNTSSHRASDKAGFSRGFYRYLWLKRSEKKS